MTNIENYPVIPGEPLIYVNDTHFDFDQKTDMRLTGALAAMYSLPLSALVSIQFDTNARESLGLGATSGLFIAAGIVEALNYFSNRD